MVAKPSWLLPKSLVDRKSTPLNSNLPSFPPRRSSDLAEHVVEYINLCPARVGGPIASGKHGCQAFVAASEKPGRSEEHTSELQSPLFPSTTLFRSRGTRRRIHQPVPCPRRRSDRLRETWLPSLRGCFRKAW